MPTRFALECAHAEASCESCHPADQPLGPVDDACASCHQDDLPATHDPATTGTCEDCHRSACGWDAESPHPEGFEAPEAHGVAANVQDPVQGDCRTCHGADLRGGEASGCDDCHAEGGHPDWRTDCTYCHGGTDGDTTGAPPQDLDDEADPSRISFQAHAAHVSAGPEFRALPCSDCHREPTDVLSPGHAFDGTPGRAEVDFSASPAPATTWDGTTCSSSACHGEGQLPDGVIADSLTPLDCDGCHRTTSGWDQMSAFHDRHLSQAGIGCADCHASVVDRAGTVIDGPLHVDGVREVALDDPAMSRDPVTGACTGSCHGFDHRSLGWGHLPNGGGGTSDPHPPGYDLPEAHGQEALLQQQDCATSGCHGTDLQGGASGQGCDDCHTAGWRSDCTYCHGGANGDTTGRPPEDVDGESDPALISFRGHPSHGDGATHLAYGCDTCHGTASLSYADAFLDPGHWLDATPGQAEVTLGGISQGSYDAATRTCSDVYCHGNGRSNGAATDGSPPLTCGGCHPDQASGSGAWGGMSGEHRRHLESARAVCSDCHYGVVRNGETMNDPALHVDGDPDVQMDPSTGLTWNGSTCSGGSCHGSGHGHSGDRW